MEVLSKSDVMEAESWLYLVHPAPVRLHNPGESRCVVLMLVLRYLSIAVIAVSNIGYFDSFSWVSCQKYYMIAPILKRQL